MLWGAHIDAWWVFFEIAFLAALLVPCQDRFQGKGKFFLSIRTKGVMALDGRVGAIWIGRAV